MLDTPIKRATILDMSEPELLAHIEGMQAQRMKAHTIYQEAMAAKAEIKSAKDAERLEKVLGMLEKTLKSVDAGLEKLKKYSSEVQVLRLTLGD